VSEADTVGEAIHHYVDSLPWREKVDRPAYIASLEELAHALKVGTFLQAAPRTQQTSDHNVPPEAAALECGEN